MNDYLGVFCFLLKPVNYLVGAQYYVHIIPVMGVRGSNPPRKLLNKKKKFINKSFLEKCC